MHTTRRISLAGLLAALLAFVGGLTLPVGTSPVSAAADPGWIHWIGPSLDDLDVWVRAFGSSGGTMYAGTEGDGVFRSTNGGLNWSKFSTNLPSDSDSIRDIEAGVSDVLIATNGGVWKSNGGAWQPLGQGEGANKLNLPAQSLYSQAGVLFAGVMGGVYKSSDSGNTWTSSSTGLPTATTVWSIDGYSYLPGYLFAATSDGAYVSLNGGGSWAAVTNGLPTGTNILRIVSDQTNPARWYAITAGLGVYKTETGGLVWEPVNSDLPTTQIRSIMLLPVGASAVVVIGTTNGVFTSFDKGATWNPVSNTGLAGHTAIWALSTTPVPLALVAGAQGGGVRYRVMAPPVNLSPPTIAGTLSVGQQLTATPGNWDGTDEITYSYRWQRCSASNPLVCTDITNATLSTFTLTSDQQGFRVRVWVEARNAVSIPANLTTEVSNPTSAVTAALGSLPGAITKQSPSITAPPGTDGNMFTVFPGEVLTATPNTWNTLPTSYAYQWYRCSTVNDSSCAPIGPFAAATTHTVSDADVGSYIKVMTRGTNGDGSALSGLGGPSPLILPRQVTSTSAPALGGKPWVGQTLTRSIGSFSGAIERAYTTWQSCPDTTGNGCSTIKGGNLDQAGIATLTLDNGHLGKHIRVRVEIDVNDASAPAPIIVSSAFSPKVTTAPAKVTNSTKPKIQGIPAPGVVLTLTKSVWGGSPTFTHRWLRCDTAGANCLPISGATASTYKVGSSDVGKRIVARMTGINAWGIPVTVQTAATATTKATLKPVHITGAEVTGKRAVGRKLTAEPGVWSASPAATFTYRWKRNGTNIAGATAKTYKLKAADKGKKITCVITAKNSVGTTAKTVKAGTVK
jgi:hypothetical protein